MIHIEKDVSNSYFIVACVFAAAVTSSQKPQETLNLTVTEEHYRALFYMPLVTEERY
jgi:hypothetical protein